MASCVPAAGPASRLTATLAGASQFLAERARPGGLWPSHSASCSVTKTSRRSRVPVAVPDRVLSAPLTHLVTRSHGPLTMTWRDGQH